VVRLSRKESQQAFGVRREIALTTQQAISVGWSLLRRDQSPPLGVHSRQVSVAERTPLRRMRLLRAYVVPYDVDPFLKKMREQISSTSSRTRELNQQVAKTKKFLQRKGNKTRISTAKENKL
jgi:hypothetical protein